MRPKAPKNGKRILLERFGFIWNKIGFIWKVTLRNIFRYKKRFLMTVLGISGCTACRKELIEAPAILMRPKAPKNGKRILLERFGFIWNKIGFIWKVTLRNIFRYKKRFLMTVLGISGCTALLLTGFDLFGK